MLEDLTKKMNALSEEVLLKDRVSKRVKELDDLIKEKQTRRSRLYAVMYRENKDVEKLKSMNLSSLFLTVIGQKGKQLDKEEKELLEAKLRLDRIDQELFLLKEDYQEEKTKLRHILTKEKEYYALMEEKKKRLLETSEYGEQASQLEKEVTEYRKLIKEINEALSAAKRALESLYQASNTLRSAKNWGTYDIISSKSWISSMVKHNKLASAKDSMSYANHALSSFAREMEDVKKVYANELTISGFDKTLDIWFDNIFTDIKVQRKINAASEDVSYTIRTINKAIEGLKKEQVNYKNKIEKIENNLEEIIVKAS